MNTQNTQNTLIQKIFKEEIAELFDNEYIEDCPVTMTKIRNYWIYLTKEQQEKWMMIFDSCYEYCDKCGKIFQPDNGYYTSCWECQDDN